MFAIPKMKILLAIEILLKIKFLEDPSRTRLCIKVEDFVLKSFRPIFVLHAASRKQAEGAFPSPAVSPSQPVPHGAPGTHLL